MYRKNNKSVVKIPVLTHEELTELGKIIHYKKEDELAEKRFWKKVYKKSGLQYDSYKDLANEFDTLILNGKLKIGFLDGSNLSNLADRDKIAIMSAIKNSKKQE